MLWERLTEREGPRWGLLPLVLVLGLTSFAGAQGLDPVGEDGALDALLAEESELLGGGETISTALGYAQTAERTPSNVFVINRKQIEAVNPRHPAEMLRFIPGFTLYRRQPNSYEISVMGAGGFLSNKVLVLLDGHRVMDPGYSNAFWQTIPLVTDTVDRIEVVVGPESTVYGSNAFAAVVNFLTQSPKEGENRLVLRAGAESFHQMNWTASTRSAESATRVTFSGEHRGSVLAVTNIATGLPSANFPTGDGFTNRSFRLQHDRDLDALTRMKFSASWTTSQPDGIQPAGLGQTRETSGDQDGLMLGLNLDRDFSQERHLSLRGSYQRSHRDVGFQPFGTFGIPGVEYDSRELDLDLRYHWEPGSWKWNLGSNYRAQHMGGIYVEPFSTKRWRSLYLNGEREFGEHWVLFLGARRLFQDLSEDATSWKVAGLYRPRPDLAVRLGIGTAFRSPDLVTTFLRPVNQLAVGGGLIPLSGPIQSPNYTLRNEKALGFAQLGVEKIWSRQRAKVTFYRAELEDLLGLRRGAPVTAFVPPAGPLVPVGAPLIAFNMQQTGKYRGVSLAYQRDLPGDLQLHAGLTFQDLDHQVEGDLFTPNRTGSLMLHRPAEGRRIGGSLSWYGVGAYPASTTVRMPGYGLLGLNLERRLGDRSSLALTVENLLDRRHHERVESFVVNPGGGNLGLEYGRTMYLSLRTEL